MFKKIVYILCAFVIGFIIYFMVEQSAAYESYVKSVNECVETENFEYVLRFFEYHNADAVYEQTNDNLSIKVFEVYASELSIQADKTVPETVKYNDVKGYVFIIYNLTNNVKTVPTDDASDETEEINQFSIILKNENYTFNYPTDIISTDGVKTEVQFNTYFDAFNLYSFTMYEPAASRYLGNVASDGEIIESIDSIDSITIIDADGNIVLADDEINLTYHNINIDDIKTNGISGYTQEEERKLEFTSDVIWSVAWAMFIYVAIVVGIGMALFYRRKPHSI